MHQKENPDIVIYTSYYHDVMAKAAKLHVPFRIEECGDMFQLLVPTIFEIPAMEKIGLIYEKIL